MIGLESIGVESIGVESILVMMKTVCVCSNKERRTGHRKVVRRKN